MDDRRRQMFNYVWCLGFSAFAAYLAIDILIGDIKYFGRLYVVYTAEEVSPHMPEMAAVPGGAWTYVIASCARSDRDCNQIEYVRSEVEDGHWIKHAYCENALATRANEMRTFGSKLLRARCIQNH